MRRRAKHSCKKGTDPPSLPRSSWNPDSFRLKERTPQNGNPHRGQQLLPEKKFLIAQQHPKGIGNNHIRFGGRCSMTLSKRERGASIGQKAQTALKVGDRCRGQKDKLHDHNLISRREPYRDHSRHRTILPPAFEKEIGASHSENCWKKRIIHRTTLSALTECNSSVYYSLIPTKGNPGRRGAGRTTAVRHAVGPTISPPGCYPCHERCSANLASCGILSRQGYFFLLS